MKNNNLEKVKSPVVGNTYTLSWAVNSFMTWKLAALYPDGTCKVKSKIGHYLTVRQDELREPLQGKKKEQNKTKIQN